MHLFFRSGLSYVIALLGTGLTIAIAPKPSLESSNATTVPALPATLSSSQLLQPKRFVFNSSPIPLKASSRNTSKTAIEPEFIRLSSSPQTSSLISQQRIKSSNSEINWSHFLFASSDLVLEVSKPPQSSPSTAQTIPTPEPTVPSSAGVTLTLSDIVVLALENNRVIKNAYLERIVQRQDLAVAEDKFVPNFIPRLSVNVQRDETGQISTSLGEMKLETVVTSKLPTGATVNFGWVANRQLQNNSGSFFGVDENNFSQNLRLNFTQPLLRGAGIAVNRASVEIARLTEQINILDLRFTLTETITEAILAYRDLVQAQEDLENARVALNNARTLLEITEALINAGRQARIELVESQANVATQELNLLQAQNALEQARLDLLDILDLDQNLPIVATAPTLEEVPQLNLEQLQQVAYQNNSQYLIAALDLQRTKYDLIQAADERRWGLDLNVGYGNNSSSLVDESSALTAGLSLSREFGDLTLEQRYQRSRVNVLQAENILENLRDRIELQVQDRVRDVQLNREQVEQARRARELSEQQLENERIKLTLGRPDTSITDIVNAQDRLAQAKNREVQAIINYLNALTNLDRTLGTTLETWQIELEATEDE